MFSRNNLIVKQLQTLDQKVTGHTLRKLHDGVSVLVAMKDLDNTAINTKPIKTKK